MEAREEAREEPRTPLTSSASAASESASSGEAASETANAAPAPASAGGHDFRARYDAIRQDACVVTSIEIRGNERTKSALIERELRRVYEAKTLDGIKDALFEANRALYEYGIFKDVAMVIDADSDRRGERALGEGDVPGAKIVVNVEERDVFNFKAGTFMSRRGEGEAEAAVGLRNPLGFGERVEFEVVRGVGQSSTYAALWEQPKVFGSDVNAETRVFQSLECFKKLSSFDVTSRGASLGLSGSGPGTLEYNIAWRDVQDPTRLASRAVRRQLGYSLKSSVSHTYVSDHLDRPVRPMSGYLWKIRSELAGIGLSDPMSTKFVKSEVTAHAVETLDASRGITASVSGRFGLLLPFGASARMAGGDATGGAHDNSSGGVSSCIADRFFLGGVGCLRQFENNGAGPSDERRASSKDASVAKDADGTPSAPVEIITRDALGGDFVWSATAAIQMDVPGEKFAAMREAGIHFHAFVSAGTLLPVGSIAGSPKDAAKVIRDATRASVGVGLVWPLPVGQIEFNYGRAIRAGASDRVRDGAQFGIAAHVSL